MPIRDTTVEVIKNQNDPVIIQKLTAHLSGGEVDELAKGLVEYPWMVARMQGVADRGNQAAVEAMKRYRKLKFDIDP
jgi:hypothetical protein